jgi:hypothetical protein
MTIGPRHRRRAGPDTTCLPPEGRFDGQDRHGSGEHMTVIAEFGIFMAGIGVFFVGCGFLWWISVWKDRA